MYMVSGVRDKCLHVVAPKTPQQPLCHLDHRDYAVMLLIFISPRAFLIIAIGSSWARARLKKL